MPRMYSVEIKQDMQHIFYRTLRKWMWVVEVKKKRRKNGCLERMILLIVSKVYLDILYLTQMVFSREIIYKDLTLFANNQREYGRCYVTVNFT